MMKNVTKKKLLIWGGSTVAGLLVIAGIVVGYFYFFGLQTSAERLFQTALEKGVSVSEDAEPYASLRVASENTELTGEFKSTMSGDSGKARFNYRIEGDQGGVPLLLDMDGIISIEGQTQKNYIRYNSVSSEDEEADGLYREYFSPVVGRWMISETKTDDDTTLTFREDGPLAAYVAFGFFTPVASLSESDRKLYMEAVNKYNMYNVESEIERSTFRGVELNKLRVTISKAAFRECMNELRQSMSEKSNFMEMSEEAIYQLFEDDEQLTADVYINDKQEFAGMEILITLRDEQRQENFNSSFQRILVSAYVEYSRQFTIELPRDVLTEKEFNNLLMSSL